MSTILSTPFHTALLPGLQDRPGDDPIFTLNAEAQRRAQAGEEITNATLGALMDDDGKLCVLPSVAEAIAGVDKARASAYAPISGPPAFLDAVIRDTFGTSELGKISTAVATPGGTGAIFTATTCFLEPGQAMLVPSFFWGPYKTIANHTRRAVETFRMFDEAGRFDLKSFEEGLAALVARQGRALVVFNFPCNNPTGYSLDEAEWEAVTDIVARQGKRAPIAFLIDLAYARFGAAGSEAWIGHMERINRVAQVLVAWSASKAFAQYGARVGALIAVHTEDDHRRRLANAFSFACRGSWSNCNHLGMLAVTELLTNPSLAERVAAERAELIELLGTRVERFNAEAQGHDLSYPRYEGGFFVSVFTPNAAKTAEVMKERGVFVVPNTGAVRVALCSTPTESIPKIVEALAAGVRAAEAG